MWSFNLEQIDPITIIHLLCRVADRLRTNQSKPETTVRASQPRARAQPHVARGRASGKHAAAYIAVLHGLLDPLRRGGRCHWPPSRGEDSGARDTKTPSKPQPGSEAGSSVARFRPHVLSMETSVVGSSARCLCEVQTRPSDLAIRTKTKLSRRLVRRSKQTTQFNGPRSHSRTVAGVNGSHYPHGVLIQRRGP